VGSVAARHENVRQRSHLRMTVEIFVFARLHARPGKQTEVREAMFEIHGPTRLEPGCLSYGAFRSVRDPDEFYIHTH
jgi:quinol monooxygenase YgiN